MLRCLARGALFIGSITFSSDALSQERLSPVARCLSFVRKLPFIEVDRAAAAGGNDDRVDFGSWHLWRATERFVDPVALQICDAIERDDLQTLDRLLDDGFDINHRGSGGMTFLLHSLAFSGRATRHLLERGADPFQPTGQHNGRPAALNCAAQVIAGFGRREDLEFLLDRGVDPNGYSPDTGTPLIRLALPSPDNYRLLVRRGGQVNLRPMDRGMPFEPFARPSTAPLPSIMFFLQSGGFFRELSFVQEIQYAGCGFGDPYLTPCLAILFGKGKLEGNRQFQWEVSDAVAWNEIDAWFRQHAIDPAKLAARYESCKAKWRDRASRCAYQLEHGGQIDGPSILTVASHREWLPPEEGRAEKFFRDAKVVKLIRAIENNDVEEIGRLISSGADLNARGEAGVTPLLWSTQSDLKTFERLLDLGADPNAALTSFYLPNPLEYLEPGDTVMHWATRYGTIGHLRSAIGHGGNANARRAFNGRTPLFDVTELATANDTKWLLQAELLGYGNYPGLFNASISREPNADNRRWPSGSSFARQTYPTFSDMCPFEPRHVYRLKVLETLETLATLGNADLDAQDVCGRTVAMVAARKNQPSVVGQLLLLNASSLPIDRLGYDLVLELVQAKRNMLPERSSLTENTDYWTVQYAMPIALIEHRGGSLAIAEKLVWKSNDRLPSIDLRKLALKDRPWLPKERNSAPLR